MKGEATGPLQADSLSWISARVLCCNTRGGPRKAFFYVYQIWAFLNFPGWNATPLRVNVFGAFGEQPDLGPMREDLTLQCLKWKLGPWEQQH